MIKFLLVFVLLLLNVTSASASVYINELSTYASSGDWVEIFANEETDISSWTLIDVAGNKKIVPENTVIGSASIPFFVVNFGNSLNREEEVVKLYSNTDLDNPVDTIRYGYEDSICSSGDGQSIGRLTDGSMDWVRFKSPTINLSNTGETDPCPTPTPSPTPTPTQTPTPSPSPTQTPTPTPSPIPSKSPSPTAKPSIKPSQTPSPDLEETDEGTVAGATSNINLEDYGASPSPLGSPSANPTNLSLNKTRAKTVMIVGIGLIFISLAMYLGYKKYLNVKGKQNTFTA